MELIIPFNIAKAHPSLHHAEKVMLLGSCFTEHIGAKMQAVKMQVLMNSHGILFNPLSIADSITAYITGKVYTDEDLFLLNETWNSWDFHSRFSHTDQEIALREMNQSLANAAGFLKEADWLVITFGSAFQYFVRGAVTGLESAVGVANCHKAPGQWFEKRLLDIPEMVAAWQRTIGELKQYNPSLKLIFTVSPVRHTKDGLIENNRSKARLIETVHRLVAGSDGSCSYFPAYEIVMDVLRDYRFFEQDLVHPNSLAIRYVWEQFLSAYMQEGQQQLLRNISEIITAAQHRPRFEHTEAHRQFKSVYLKKIKQLQSYYPYLELEKECRHFSEL